MKNARLVPYHSRTGDTHSWEHLGVHNATGMDWFEVRGFMHARWGYRDVEDDGSGDENGVEDMEKSARSRVVFVDPAGGPFLEIGDSLGVISPDWGMFKIVGFHRIDNAEVKDEA